MLSLIVKYLTIINYNFLAVIMIGLCFYQLLEFKIKYRLFGSFQAEKNVILIVLENGLVSGIIKGCHSREGGNPENQ
jgi:hypothetical protein